MAHDPAPRGEFSPLGAGDPAEATVFRCPLCGGRFTHGARTCGACPLDPHCGIVACPHCGYSFPRGSRIVDWLRAARRRLGGSS